MEYTIVYDYLSDSESLDYIYLFIFPTTGILALLAVKYNLVSDRKCVITFIVGILHLIGGLIFAFSSIYGEY